MQADIPSRYESFSNQEHAASSREIRFDLTPPTERPPLTLHPPLAARQTYSFGIGLNICQMEVAVPPERHVKLFKNGRNQAVRIPREFELSGEDAIMRKEGERLIIEPTPPKSLLALLATLVPLDEDFPPIPDPVPDPVEL